MIYNNLSLIVAVADNLAIGRNNSMPWHLRSDLQYFKATTMGKTMIMGRNTFASLGYRQLPGRRSIVITSDPKFASKYQVTTYSSVKMALDALSGESEIMVIGGGKLYKECINYAQKLYVTKISAVIDDADVFFPEYSNDFELISSDPHKADEQNDYDFSFCIYRRK